MASAHSSELNRGRTEERCLTAFAVSPTRVQFPFAEQAAQLTRRIQLPGQPAKEAEIEFLLTSRPAGQMNAEQMLRADRRYWGIENGLHQRLDVIAGEDRSRVRHRNAALNLAVIRRAVVRPCHPLDWSLPKSPSGDHERLLRFHVRPQRQKSLQTRNQLQTLLVTRIMIQS